MNIKHVPDLTHRHDADFYKTDKWREEEAKEHAKQIKNCNSGLISSMKLRINNGVLSVKYA